MQLACATGAFSALKAKRKYLMAAPVPKIVAYR